MKIITENNELLITECFSGVGFETSSKEILNICMRDTGFEFTYEGIKYFAKLGKISQDGWIKGLPPEDLGEVMAYSKYWIDEDFNPDGIRIGFMHNEGYFISSKWCDNQDTYVNHEETLPEFFKILPNTLNLR